jgi:putative tryptophan/tyrosine transport system substrate-binding protein
MRALLALCAVVTVAKNLRKSQTRLFKLSVRPFAAALCLTVATSTVADDRLRPKIGTIFLLDPASSAPWREAFQQGLQDLGYIEGRNVALLPRYAGGNAQRFPQLVDELIAAQVDVIFVVGQAVYAAKQRTDSVPIVCADLNDPVAEGLVASLARPGGNLTGLSWQSSDASGKRLELGNEIVPQLRRIALFFDDSVPYAVSGAAYTRKAANAAGVQIRAFHVRDTRSIDEALSASLTFRPQLFIVIDSSATTINRERFASYAIKAKVPLISEEPVWAKSGALLAYGPNGRDMFRRAARYVDRILKGANPGDLPIEQPTKFELVVNLKTANALGITIAQSILLRADEVIP